MFQSGEEKSYNTIQYDTMRNDSIRHNAIQYNRIRYDKMQYNTIQYDTIQYFKRVARDSDKNDDFVALYKINRRYENLKLSDNERYSRNVHVGLPSDHALPVMF